MDWFAINGGIILWGVACIFLAKPIIKEYEKARAEKREGLASFYGFLMIVSFLSWLVALLVLFSIFSSCGQRFPTP